MSKYYLSRSITRAMSADHPIGDPTGGAAYGEKNDPISAGISILSMASSYGAAATAAGVGAGIGATFSAMTIMQGITFVGGALSLVGNITGNKTLSKIGMVAGVVGGLGQMGAFGETAKGATFTGGGTSSVTPTADTSATTTSGAVPAGQELAYTPAPKVDFSNYQGNPLNQPAAAPAVAPPINTPSVNAPPVDGSAVAAYTGKSVTPVSNAPAAPSIYDMDKAVADRLIAPKGYDSGQGLWDKTKNILGAPIEFAEKNPYSAMAIGQTAQPIAEYLSGKTDAEIEALEAQTRANEANAGFADARTEQLKEEIAREKMRRRNLNAGYMYVNTGFNVNPNANLTSQGLISKNMQPAG
jgi:hypothetical protein